MDAVPLVISLDALAAKLRKHKAAPKSLNLTFPITPDLSLGVEATSPNSDHVGLVLRWPTASAARKREFACEVATKGGQGRDFSIVASISSNGVGYVAWSWLRGAVAEAGASLEAALLTAPKAPPVGPSDICVLHIPGGGAGTFAAAGGAMLDGPFTDVAVAAGGQRFRAHRVVLAAASPVFLSMLGGGMREAREAAVELRDADPAVVQLLLRHIYGGAIEVPLPLALPLYALADQYQLSSGLQRQLRLWLASLQLAPDALCGLFPAALSVCPQLASGCWRLQAAQALPALSALPAFVSWPIDAVVEVIKSPTVAPLAAFEAAVWWMEGQEKPAKQRHHWPRLLDCIPWTATTARDLHAMRRYFKASEVPGLTERLFDAWERLGTWLPAGATAELPTPA